MQTTPWDFTPQFPAFRKAALAGKAVAIRDRAGHEFTFTLKRPSPKTLAEAVAHLAGVAKAGVKRKTLRRYGAR